MCGPYPLVRMLSLLNRIFEYSAAFKTGKIDFYIFYNNKRTRYCSNRKKRIYYNIL